MGFIRNVKYLGREREREGSWWQDSRVGSVSDSLARRVSGVK